MKPQLWGVWFQSHNSVTICAPLEKWPSTLYVGLQSGDRRYRPAQHHPKDILGRCTKKCRHPPWSVCKNMYVYIYIYMYVLLLTYVLYIYIYIYTVYNFIMFGDQLWIFAIGSIHSLANLQTKKTTHPWEPRLDGCQVWIRRSKIWKPPFCYHLSLKSFNKHLVGSRRSLRRTWIGI